MKIYFIIIFVLLLPYFSLANDREGSACEKYKNSLGAPHPELTAIKLPAIPITSVKIDFYLSQLILQRIDASVARERLVKRTRIAEKCINRALSSLGNVAPLKVRILIGNIEWFEPSTSNTWSHSPFIPDIDNSGQAVVHPIGPSSDTDRYNVVVLTTNMSHAEYVFNSFWNSMTNSKAFIPVLDYEKSVVQLLTAMSDTRPDELLIMRLVEKVNSLGSSLPDTWKKVAELFPNMNSEILISNTTKLKREFIEYGDDKYEGIILAHEFLHTFGGLLDEEDDHEDSRQVTPNLMRSSRKECILREDQILTLLNNRK